MKNLNTRQKAALHRVNVAQRHLSRAVREIQAARADLSSVTGAPDVILARLEEVATVELSNLSRYAVDPRARRELDHEPTRQELRCGHGPRHGCGKGGR